MCRAETSAETDGTVQEKNTSGKQRTTVNIFSQWL